MTSVMKILNKTINKAKTGFYVYDSFLYSEAANQMLIIAKHFSEEKSITNINKK